MSGEIASAYDQVTRTRLEILESRFNEEIATIRQDIKDMRRDIQEIRDELSRRMPPWATFAFGATTFLAGTLVSFLLR